MTGARSWVFGGSAGAPERARRECASKWLSRAGGRGRQRRPARVRDAARGARQPPARQCTAHPAGDGARSQTAAPRSRRQRTGRDRLRSAASSCSNPMPPVRDLRDDLLDAVVMTVFLEGREPLRNAAAFDARGERARRNGSCRRRRSRAPCSPRWSGWRESWPRCPRLLRRPPTGSPVIGLAPCSRDPDDALGAIARVSALPAGHRTAARRPRATRSSRPRSSRWRGRYRERIRAERGMRPAGSNKFRWLLEELRGVVVRPAAQDPCPGVGTASRGRMDGAGARAPGLRPGCAAAMLNA